MFRLQKRVPRFNYMMVNIQFVSQNRDFIESAYTGLHSEGEYQVASYKIVCLSMSLSVRPCLVKYFFYFLSFTTERRVKPGARCTYI